MQDILKRNPAAVLIAVAMHVAIIAFMLVGVDWLEKPVQPKSKVDIVQAKMIDQSRIDAEIAKLKKADDAKKTKEKQRLANIKRKQEREKKKLAELEKKRKAREKKAKADAKKRAAAEKKRKADAKKKAADEKRRKTAEKKKKLAAEKKRQAAAEARKKAEAEKRRKAAEARKKAETEKKRKAAEAKKKAEAEKKRKAAEAAARLAAEQKMLEDALQAELDAERMATEREQFLYAIKQKIENNWLRPTTVSDGLSCQLRVRLMPGGVVASVAVTRSSGNGAFDRSVEKAVYKADPLPVPKGAGFEAFRDLSLNFNPTKR